MTGVSSVSLPASKRATISTTGSDQSDIVCSPARAESLASETHRKPFVAGSFWNSSWLRDQRFGVASSPLRSAAPADETVKSTARKQRGSAFMLLHQLRELVLDRVGLELVAGGVEVEKIVGNAVLEGAVVFQEDLGDVEIEDVLAVIELAD